MYSFMVDQNVSCGSKHCIKYIDFIIIYCMFHQNINSSRASMLTLANINLANINLLIKLVLIWNYWLMYIY